MRQTAAVAAKLGPLRGAAGKSYWYNRGKLFNQRQSFVADLFNTQIEMCDALTDPNAQLEELATRVEAQGFRPYVIPVGGSNALGALGYVGECAGNRATV